MKIKDVKLGQIVHLQPLPKCLTRFLLFLKVNYHFKAGETQPNLNTPLHYFIFPTTTKKHGRPKKCPTFLIWHNLCCVCIILLFANVVSNRLSPSFLYRSGAEMGSRQILRYHHSRHDIPASLSEMCTSSFLLYSMLMCMSQLELLTQFPA